MKKFEEYSKDELELLYKNHSIKQLACLFNVKEGTLKKRFFKLQIKKQEELDENTLRQLFIIENLTAKEIANKFNVKLEHVKNKLKRFNIRKPKELISANLIDRWNNEAYKKSVTNKIKNARQTEESRKLTSEISKENWKNTEYKKIIKQKLKTFANKEEERKRRAIRAKDLWKDDSYKEKVNFSRKIAMSTDNYKKVMKENSKKLWKDENYRRKVTKAVSLFYQDENNKKRHAAKIKAIYENNPEIKEKISKNSKKMWSNPNHRKSMIEESYKGKHLEEYINDNLFIQKVKELKTIKKLCEYFEVHHHTITNRTSVLNISDMIEHERSGVENEVFDYIKSIYDGEIIRNTRKVLNNYKELDIYIPEKRIAIEFNGSFWHNSENKNRSYHFCKSIEAEKNNIRLIHIWECDWIDETKKIILKDILRNLFLKDRKRIYARKCIIKEITNKEFSTFCEKNHIQGKIRASFAFGLFFNEELIQGMSFSNFSNRNRVNLYKNEYTHELIRSCTKVGIEVVGGFSKLLKYFIENKNPKSILSYCDFDLFSGISYSKNGFTFDGYTGPNLFFIDKCTGKRISRCAYRHKEQMDAVKENKWFKCYGAGSKRYVLKVEMEN